MKKTPVTYESLEDYLAEGERLFGSDRKKWVFVCPLCRTKQTADDLYKIGVPPDGIEGYIGYSCIGRWADKPNSALYGDSKKIKGKGCDYTLGGLIALPGVIIKHQGKKHFRFAFGEGGNNE